MDFQFLLQQIWRRRWLILGVALLAGLAAFFVASSLPRTYKSDATVSTGIITFRGVSLQTENPFIQQFQIESAFNDRMELLKSRTILRLFTQKLLEHDIRAIQTGEKPFRSPKFEGGKISLADIKTIDLNTSTINDTLGLLKVSPLSSLDNRRINELAEVFGYDHIELLKMLDISRVSDTDFLGLNFKAESPELAYFGLNTYLKEFFEYYKSEILTNSNKSVAFYRELAVSKKEALDSKLEEINEHRRSNGLVDIESQSESVVSQRRELEIELEKERQVIPSLRASIKNLNTYLAQYNRENGDNYADGIFYQSDIQDLDQQIKAFDDQYINSSLKDKAAKEKAENLRKRKNDLIKKLAYQQLSKNDKLDDRVETIIKQRIDKEQELERAEASVRSLQVEINVMKGRSVNLVADDVKLNQLVQETDILKQEYLEIVGKLQQSELAFEGIENPMELVEKPQVPEKPESSMRAILSVFSAIAAGSITVFLLLLVGLLDKTYRNSNLTTKYTQLPTIAIVNEVKPETLSFSTMFQQLPNSKKDKFFTEAIRKLRFVIDSHPAKIILWTSPNMGDGKSFLMAMLANAIGVNDKKVLLVDTNFKHNSLSQEAAANYQGYPLSRQNKNGMHIIEPQDFYLKGQLIAEVKIVANSGEPASPWEILDKENFNEWLTIQRSTFDYIFLEGPSLVDFADSQELATFADQIILVVNANAKHKSQDDKALEQLKSTGKPVIGVVLNKVNMSDITA